MADYIKREDAREKLCSMCRWEGENCGECEHPIDDISAADVRPVVRGRWIEEFDGFIRSYTCSECGEYALTKEETMNDAVCSNFCPNCGAKMEVPT